MTPLLNTQDSAVGTTGARSAVSCTDTELAARIRELEQRMRVLLMEQLQFIAEAGHRGLHAELGFRSAQVWLQGLLNIDPRDAATRVKVARNVEDRQSLYGEVMPADLPETAAALAEGAIGLEHARVIVDGVRRLPEYARCHQVGEVESTLAAYARTMTPRDLEKLAERIRYLLDQDGAYDDEETQHETRELHYTTARDGMTVIKARLDRETGAKFAALIEPLAAPRPENEGDKDPRTVGQRNADGFAAILDLALDHDGVPRTGGQRPHMTISIDFEDLKRGLGFVDADTGMPCTLNTDRAITAENARRIACDAEVLPMLLDGDSLPLDVGRAKRTAPTHLRAALLQRDGVCAFPGCDRPPGTPEAHHVEHWVDGGATELGNMVMLCGHHRTLHNQRWEITMRDDRPMFIPPPTVDPRRTPRPGGTALPAQHRAIIDRHLPVSRGYANTPAC